MADWSFGFLSLGKLFLDEFDLLSIFNSFAVRMEYDPDLLPEHPCLETIANSEQILNLHSSRRLITMQKIMEPKVKFGINFI